MRVSYSLTYYFISVCNKAFTTANFLDERISCKYDLPFPGCKDDWIRNDIFCYKMFKTEVTFFEANSSCINGGAELVSIEDSQELSFLDELLIKEHVDKIYVGMTDIAEEDRWVWMDGSPVTLDPLWHGNHPNGGTNENCGEYVKQHGFHDKNCETDKRPFVCKYSLYNL